VTAVTIVPSVLLAVTAPLAILSVVTPAVAMPSGPAVVPSPVNEASWSTEVSGFPDGPEDRPWAATIPLIEKISETIENIIQTTRLIFTAFSFLFSKITTLRNKNSRITSMARTQPSAATRLSLVTTIARILRKTRGFPSPAPAGVGFSNWKFRAPIVFSKETVVKEKNSP